MTYSSIERRLLAIEQHVKPRPDRVFDAWIKTVSDDDIDTMAEAAKASLDKGMSTVDSSLVDADVLDRLNADYARFMAEHEQHPRI